MDFNAIRKFIPIDSRKKVTELTSYLSACSTSERLPIEYCVKYIKDVRLCEIFFLKCLTQNLFPEKENFIKYMQKIMFDTNSIAGSDVASKEAANEIEAETRAKARKLKAETKNRTIQENKRSKELKMLNIAKEKTSFLNGKNNNAQDSDSITRKNTKRRNNIEITPVDMESRVFANVSADELTIKEGVIIYHQYSLYSSRITNVDKDILGKIDHTFHLIKDGLSSKINDQRFYFWPCNDLSFLLGEIERLQASSSDSSSTSFPQNGRFFLPWKYVFFCDGIMYLEHPNTSKRGTLAPFHYRHSNILKSYRDIFSYIETRCPQFDVGARDGVIYQVFNFSAFTKMIPHFYEKVNHADKDIDLINESVPVGKTFTKSGFVNHIKKVKSPYISFLSKKQVENRLIYYLLESVNHISSESDHEEYGYLFTIKECLGKSILIYENVTDESRSSIVFIVHSTQFAKAIEKIRRFLASSINNKRQKLANSKVRINDMSIMQIERIIHNDYCSWQSQVNSLC